MKVLRKWKDASRLAALGLFSIAAVSCGSSSETSAESEPELPITITGTLLLAGEQLQSAIPGVSSDAVAALNSPSKRTANGSFALGDLSESGFTTTDVGPGNDYFTTPQTFLKYIINKDVDVDPSDGMGLIARFEQKITSGMCPILAQFPDEDEDGIPDVGEGEFNLPDFADETVAAELEAKCEGLNLDSLANASGVEIGYTVVDVSAEADSVYDIKATISFGNTGSINNIVFFKADGKVTRFLFGEPAGGHSLVDGEEEGDDEGEGSFTLFEYDGKTVKFDFFGGSNDGHYRMLYDTTTRKAALFAWVSMGSSVNYMGLTTDRNEDIAAFTMSSSGTTDTVTNGQVCVDVSGSLPAFSSAVSDGACGNSTAADFSTAPEVLTHISNFSAAAENFKASISPAFASEEEVFTAELLP